MPHRGIAFLCLAILFSISFWCMYINIWHIYADKHINVYILHVFIRIFVHGTRITLTSYHYKHSLHMIISYNFIETNIRMSFL